MKMRVLIALLAVVTTSLSALAPGLVAQERVMFYDFMRPGLEWHTIETEHFLIHFHEDSSGVGAGRTAEVVARIAEEIYGPITDLYEYEPDPKVSIVLKDYEDYSNGAAYFLDNKIDIWAPSLASPLRGEHAWLRNVITHEFTHIVQVQKAMKGSRKWPFYYIQWLAYEDVRRPDVLNGYPDVIVSYPVPILNNPAWFAEGTAQYQRADLHYDTWDTHRDMLMRSRFLAGKDFDLGEMSDLLSKTSIEREQVYNQGFAFTTYLANEYGEESLREISDKLGGLFTYTVENAIGDALGRRGTEVFAEWSDEVREGYTASVEAIKNAERSGDVIEDGGAFNFSPKFSPDGRRIAFTSSKGSDFSFTSLYVVDRDSSLETAVHIDRLHTGHDHSNHTCMLGNSLARVVTGSIDWKPDGSAIVYAITRDTPIGHLRADLWEIDLETEEKTRLTVDARATAPAYSPDGETIAYVVQNDGTTNLALIERDEPERPRLLTEYNDGTQVYAPAWHPDGRSIYFAVGPAEGGRDIMRFDLDRGVVEPVLATEADERDPFVSPDGRLLYFSTDRTGIFNVNRGNLNSAGALDAASLEQLTNVTGGGFGPAVDDRGDIAYSLFGGDGYSIAVLESPAGVDPIEYAPPDILQKRPGKSPDRPEIEALNDADDTDIVHLPAAESEDILPYSDTFSSFQFYPVVRLDWYANAERASLDNPDESAFQGGEFLRNTKLGLYMSSREVLDGLSFTAGILFGFWSKPWDSFGDFMSPGRLDKLERDVFFRFDYRKGLPFFKKKWAPQLSVEFFNVVRNVENGLAIEEFPCTACYPDTTYADISYSLWEVNLNSRSKLSRFAMLELGYRYSPYRARTDAFFSEEAGFTIPASSTRYFIGHGLGAKLYFEARLPHLNSDILPLGVRAEVGYEYQPGRLLDDFTIEDGQLLPEYLSVKNHQFLADVRLGWRLPFGNRYAPHGLGVRARATTIIGGEVDSFFNDYVGGLVGARGYPFYALGGNETVWLQLAYQFPIFSHIGSQIAFLRLNKLYGRVFADAAAAWSTGVPGIDEVRTDLGGELRLGISSFYLLPTAVFLSATYGFDEFIVRLDEGFVTPDGRPFVQYGGQLLWHFGVLFEFDL